MNCRLIKELMSYQSANRLLITGTPLQNNVTELWSLLHFLLPDIFNDLDSFQGWFDFSSVLDNKGEEQGFEQRKRSLVTVMHSILKPFLLRRLKTDVEESLPKKREYILYAPMTPEQKELYREILSGNGRQFLERKAYERLMAKNPSSTRSQSLKRSREDDESDMPNKSAKSSDTSTPVDSRASSRRGRRRRSYKDITDYQFDVKLAKLEMGIEEEPEAVEIDDSEREANERAENMKLASRC